MRDYIYDDPRNQGHGHVFPRPDGIRAKCGGTEICLECRFTRDRQLDGLPTHCICGGLYIKNLHGRAFCQYCAELHGQMLLKPPTQDQRDQLLRELAVAVVSLLDITRMTSYEPGRENRKRLEAAMVPFEKKG